MHPFASVSPIPSLNDRLLVVEPPRDSLGKVVPGMQHASCMQSPAHALAAAAAPAPHM